MFAPRATRIQALAGRAYEAARASGVRSIDAAILQIGLTFGENRRINERKLAVENAMRRGAGAVRTRCEFGDIAFACPPEINGALRAVEHLYRTEIMNRRTRQLNGFPLKHSRVEHHLIEARIFLRWYRRFGNRAKFESIIDGLTTSPAYAVEAAE